MAGLMNWKNRLERLENKINAFIVQNVQTLFVNNGKLLFNKVYKNNKATTMLRIAVLINLISQKGTNDSPMRAKNVVLVKENFGKSV